MKTVQRTNRGEATTSETTISAAGLRIIKLLVGNPPQTVADLIAATGVTRTAVTEQLNELVAAGFVERTVERLPGRGRPRHLYSATHAALLLLFASNQQLVVPAIWQAIEEIGGRDVVDRVLHRVSTLMALHYCRRIKAVEPADRLRQLSQLFCEEGCLVEVQTNPGGVVMRKRSCGLIAMFEDQRHICTIDEEMMSSVVGRPVKRVACRHDGAPCCTFEIV